MVIYLDLIFFINLVFDFSILLTVDVLLKRNIKLIRAVIGALIGEASMLTLFFDFNNFLFKIILTILMSIGCFSYKDFKYTAVNSIYLYLVGIILGGFEYYLYNEFQVSNGFNFKYFLILTLAPLILFIYCKLSKKLKNNYNNRHSLKVKYTDGTFEGVGYLDSGNKLVSPISGKKVILIEKEYIVYHKLKLIPIPYNALNHHGIIYCFNPDEVLVDNVRFDDCLIGLSEVKFNIDGCNALLNARMENL